MPLPNDHKTNLGIRLDHDFFGFQQHIQPFSHSDLSDATDQHGRWVKLQFAVQITCRLTRLKLIQINAVVQHMKAVWWDTQVAKPLPPCLGYGEQSIVQTQVCDCCVAHAHHVTQMTQ